MATRSKLVLVALTAAAFMSIAVGTASARRLEVSNQHFRVVWTLLTFEIEGIATVSCPVTLEGSFHSRTTSKVSGQLIGYITRAIVRGGSTECNGTGRATALTETLPWHIRYDSFTGSLPNITGIRIQLINAAFKVRPESPANECLARTSASNPAAGIVNVSPEGTARTLRADETANIPLTGELACFFTGGSHFRGTGEVFVQGSTTTRITVRLVQ